MTKEQEIVYNASKVESWKISGVSHRDETGTYEVIGEMTPLMTQDALAEKYGIGIPSMPLIWAIATKTHELKDQNPKDSEKLRVFLQNGLGSYPNTSTRIIYNHSGKDKIIHNYKTSDQYSLDGKVVGPNDWINEILDENILEKLLGTSNIKQINKVSQWINGIDMRLWRINSNPKTKIEKAARFSGGGYWLSLYCDRDPLSTGPAFLVLKVD